MADLCLDFKETSIFFSRVVAIAMILRFSTQLYLIHSSKMENNSMVTTGE
jgi:hypothetical protein